jgi:hypothetical protein
MALSSASSAGYFEIPTHIAGTTFDPVRLAFTVDDVAPDFTDAYARMQVRDEDGNLVAVEDGGDTSLDWTTSNHPDTQNAYLEFDTVNGYLWLTGPGVLTPSTAGQFAFDVKIVLADGETRIDLRGRWTIEIPGTV